MKFFGLITFFFPKANIQFIIVVIKKFNLNLMFFKMYLSWFINFGLTMLSDSNVA